MAISLSEIRQRFASTIAAIDAEWTECRNPVDVIRAANGPAQKRFAVSVASTVSRRSRDRQATGVETDSILEVRFLYRMNPKNQVAGGYDLALDESEAIIKAITNKTPALYAGIQNIQFLEARFDPVPSGEWLVSTLRFNVYHYIPLA